MKKQWILIIIILAILLVGGVIYIIPPLLTETNVTINNSYIVVDKNGPISDCNLTGVTIIHKEGCPACEIVLPILEEIESENNLNFEYIDLATHDGRNRMYEIGIVPYYVPTTIINCNAYIGVYTKEEYEQALGV